jgi:hypothetical protein
MKCTSRETGFLQADMSKLPEKLQNLLRDSAATKMSPLGLPQHQIDDPTPANVNLLRVAAVVQHIGVVTPGVLERVREDGHGAEVSRFVHGAGKGNRGVRPPLRGEADRPEGIAEDVTKQRN